MTRAIYRCKHPACAKQWAFDYGETETLHCGYGRTTKRRYRVDDQQRRQYPGGMDAVCPGCQRPTRAWGTVKGSYSDTPCDHRCTSATGFQCSCRCGGKNHGAGLLNNRPGRAALACDAGPLFATA